MDMGKYMKNIMITMNYIYIMKEILKMIIYSEKE